MSPEDLRVPAPLKGEEGDTWAQSTILRRFPDILKRTMAENEFSPSRQRRLQLLQDEIPQGPIRHLQDDHGPDNADWCRYISPYEGKNWLEVPWFFVEHYFYRRIMEAVDYFRGGPDPFLHQKERGLESAQGLTGPLSRKVNTWVRGDQRLRSDVGEMLYLDLWGNQADLSLWPAESENTPDHAGLEEALKHLLADDSERGLSLLQSMQGKGARIDFVIDNAGLELVSDLAFADLLLAKKWADEVRFHVKGHPTFVSDAVDRDVQNTVQALHTSDQESVREMGERLQGYLDGGRLSLHEHFFWNSPLAFWDLPRDVFELLEEAELMVSKGDANYRRLVGDRHWPFHTPFSRVVDYLPVPVLALRTLKAEVVVGLSPESIHRAQGEDPEWMIDGRWGLIQFAEAFGGEKGQ